MNNYLPDFLGVNLKDTKLEADIQGQVRGSLNFERTFVSQNHKSPQYRDTLIFTGVVMEGYMMVKIQENKDDEGDYGVIYENQVNKQSNKNKKPKKEIVTVELIPAFTINMNSIDIFDKQTWQQQL